MLRSLRIQGDVLLTGPTYGYLNSCWLIYTNTRTPKGTCHPIVQFASAIIHLVKLSKRALIYMTQHCKIRCSVVLNAQNKIMNEIVARGLDICLLHVAVSPCWKSRKQKRTRWRGIITQCSKAKTLQKRVTKHTTKLYEAFLLQYKAINATEQVQLHN